MSDVHGNTHECCERVFDLERELAAAIRERDELAETLSTKCECHLVDQMVVPCAYHKGIEDELTRERDEARAALRDCIKALDDCAGAPDPACTYVLQSWRKAAGIETP